MKRITSILATTFRRREPAARSKRTRPRIEPVGFAHRTLENKGSSYVVKIQKYDPRAVGEDVAQPCVIEIVGRTERADEARAYARMWARHDCVASVWIEAPDLPN